MKCDPTTSGRSVFQAGAELEAERDGTRFPLRLTAVRPHMGRLLIRAERVDDADAAKALAGAILLAPRERLEVGAEEYLDTDLAGCRVLGLDGTEYGLVDAVEHYPASDMLAIGKTLVPMVAAIVREIDIAARRIVIDPPAGLFDER